MNKKLSPKLSFQFLTHFLPFTVSQSVLLTPIPQAPRQKELVNNKSECQKCLAKWKKETTNKKTSGPIDSGFSSKLVMTYAIGLLLPLLLELEW